MAEAPAADITTTPELIRTLLRAAGVPHAELPLTLASSGWDNDVWRLGDDLAVRVPRRDFAADLIRHEQLSLPVIARALAPAVVLVPEPVVAGAASALFPYAWSVVPWFRGTTALDVPRGERTQWAGQLADALARLHQPAPAWAPKNPYRGVPFAERDEVITKRMQTLQLEPPVQEAWRDAVAAPPHAGAPVWIHGDLHPDNIVIDEGAVRALIDFGDVTSGDPAYDLAVAWLVFDAEGRAVFRAASPQVDDATWIRARGWAVAIAAMLLEFSDDKPRYRALAVETLAEV